MAAPRPKKSVPSVQIEQPRVRAAARYEKQPDNSRHPVPYEIQTLTALDARDIEFGIQLIGQGKAWIGNISITFTGAFVQ